MNDNLIEGILHLPDERAEATLRNPANFLQPLKGGVIVPRNFVRDYRLKPGLLIKGEQRGRQISKIVSIENGDPADWGDHVGIYDSTALDPEPMIKLEHRQDEFTTRAIDILSPIGFGQRGLIVAPPRTGKTILLQHIAKGIAANYPDVALYLLLVDERPEEVTDMKRNVPGTLFASSNDNTIEKHLDLAMLVIERCKRLVEYRKDVIVLCDSLTRLGRSFNAGSNSGKTMSGGIDSRALEIPKRLFGAARKLEEGGSLTILATCLIDTGSRMDQVIFEEFKGTGNMELTLDRTIANQRIFPAINIPQTATRKEEKLFAPEHLEPARRVRRHLTNMPPIDAIKNLTAALGRTKTNAELFASMKA